MKSTGWSTRSRKTPCSSPSSGTTTDRQGEGRGKQPPWVHLEIRDSKSSDDATAFTDRLLGEKARSATGRHPFDRLAAAHEIEHRLTRPGHPATNGMVARFNGRIAKILQRHRFISRRDLDQTIQRHTWLYNHHINQKALGHQPPISAMKEWHRERPELFQKKPVNRPGPDI
ncbi:MAG: integrase core domain-containing protein [Pseudomonadota bacterium]